MLGIGEPFLDHLSDAAVSTLFEGLFQPRNLGLGVLAFDGPHCTAQTYRAESPQDRSGRYPADFNGVLITTISIGYYAMSPGISLAGKRVCGPVAGSDSPSDNYICTDMYVHNCVERNATGKSGRYSSDTLGFSAHDLNISKRRSFP